ncbi:MAG: TatD family hydrolase, TatD DNase family protein [Candidatus Peregrinibacteria bacterium GW2011_GWF2_33_10]|nr:MAG: TatD family hydrolase, TatD DNase family protein [Candidatus Peregrinibacteria bacterium GW2011_GWF2_33_10]OGJ44443.1 MAG: hypothetical protein A2272_01185 [Candidatus Peregrinibacteria bacterium RIFOXYA12_FULL_33_12]OGJ45009.1 MAG: hypothetical protein A2263_03040 [Candidatus Peregrinibacteria bacterium RIFOXYA2_FULL_33_21]OGJ51705.1 MAG: hypothetical protein A2307_05340 [Candidatus Peregrinibacteria bacterium RIFOXYB2_FULL_33_20]
MLIDSHCHLNIKDFDQDFDEVVKRMFENKISRVINVGCDLKTSKRALDLADKYDYMYATVGLHPHEAKNFSKDILDEFEVMIENNQKIIGIGETGLDYFRNLSTEEEQKTVFNAQIGLAKRYNLPLIIHCREAYEDVYEILVQYDLKKVIFHCFAGNLEFAKKLWNHNWITSFTGIITYPKNIELREIVKNCPINSFLLETDCPYLSPQKFRGQRNEPAFMIETAKCLAECKSLDLAEVAELENQNIKNIFGI